MIVGQFGWNRDLAPNSLSEMYHQTIFLTHIKSILELHEQQILLCILDVSSLPAIVGDREDLL